MKIAYFYAKLCINEDSIDEKARNLKENMKAEADFEMTRSLMTQILAHFLKTIFTTGKKEKTELAGLLLQHFL